MITRENTLTERERYILSALASDLDPATAVRAQALLLWGNGDSREQIAQTTGLGAAQIQRLTRGFAQKRLEVFAPSSVERASRGLSGKTTVESLLRNHHVNLAHARFVCDTALKILDDSAEVHKLGPEWRRLLENAALLHNLGSPNHDEKRHRAGRNTILLHDLDGFTPRERDMLACLTLFHTKKVRAEHDAIFSALDPEAQRVTLILAAILRIADGLDFSQTQSTTIVSLDVDSLVQAMVEGPEAEVDAARANKKADLWREVLSPPFAARLSDGRLPAGTVLRRRPKAGLGVRAQESITRAGRKIVAAQLARIRELEPKVRGGRDADSIHDMRVATRRMRSAFRLLARFYPDKVTKKLRGPLRKLAGLLGDVRDLDVMIENLRAYAATLPLEQQRSLDPLLVDWQSRRAQTLRDLVDEMDDPDYEEWIERLDRFTEQRDVEAAPRVADVTPMLVWKRYGKIREFEPIIKHADLSTLHHLRIQCKRLRYAIEFFSEVMGPESAALLDPLIAVQDHVGNMHDADVAAALVTEFIARRASSAQRQGTDGGNLEALTSYLAALRQRVSELQTGFPDRWSVIIKPSYRQALGAATATP